MAKKKETEPTPRAEKNDTKLAIKGDLDAVVKATFFLGKPPEKRG